VAESTPKEAAKQSDFLQALDVNPLEFILLYEALRECPEYKLRGRHSFGSNKPTYYAVQEDILELKTKMVWCMNKLTKEA